MSLSFAHTLAGIDCLPVVPSPGSRTAPATMPLFGLDLVDAHGADVVERLLDGRRRRVAFVNAHCVNVMSSDPAYAAALASADMLLPDGIGVELAARMTGSRLSENLNGTDFVPRLLTLAARRGLSVFLFGAADGVAKDAARRLCMDISGLRIVGTRDGYDGARDEDAAIAAINASGADIVIVAMGVPRQDVWLQRNAHRLSADLCLGVGALLDFLSGRVLRAPSLVRSLRMEWAWRLALEPRRLAGRYLLGNMSFMARAVRNALRAGDGGAMAKRGMDILLSGLGLLVLAPLLLLVALAIRLDSRGPVFFTQTRVGKDGVPFSVYKFRSMHVDAEARRAALLATSDREGVCFKSRHDPRVTRVGRLLRRYSIDELPQILNIVKGEMSVIGPRPALPEEVAAYPARALARLAVRPGLTGVWQVSGRADIGFDKMVDMDTAYAASRSLLLDIILIGLTFRAVISGRGAY